MKSILEDVKKAQAKKETFLIEKVREITGIDFQVEDIGNYELIEELIRIIEKERYEREENDYDAELEVPTIHGKGISY